MPSTCGVGVLVRADVGEVAHRARLAVYIVAHASVQRGVQGVRGCRQVVAVGGQGGRAGDVPEGDIHCALGTSENTVPQGHRHRDGVAAGFQHAHRLAVKDGVGEEGGYAVVGGIAGYIDAAAVAARIAGNGVVRKVERGVSIVGHVNAVALVGGRVVHDRVVNEPVNGSGGPVGCFHVHPTAPGVRTGGHVAPDQVALQCCWHISALYDFTHDKIRAVLYHAAGPQRAILHGQVMAALERLYAGRLEPIVEQLAHHAEQAGDREKALVYLPLAAARAARLYAHAEALGYYERALQLLAADDLRRWPLLLEAGRVLRNLSRYDEALTTCQQVVAGEDRHAAIAAAIEMSAIYRSRLDYAEARTWVAQVEGLLEALSPTDPEGRRAQAQARRAAAEIERAQGNLARARALFEQGLAFCRDLDDHRGAAECLAGLGQVHLVGGRLEEARHRFEEALAAFQTLGDRRREAVCLRNLGTVAWRQGRYDAARQLFTAGLEICRAIGDRAGETEAIGHLGLAFIAAGKPAEARDCWEESAALCRALGLEKQAGRWLHNLGNLYLDLGLYADAQRCLEESLAVDQAIGAKPDMALNLGWLGKLGLLRGAWADAVRYLEAAIALDGETDGSVEATWHYAWLAAASCALGDLTRARACSEEAVRLAGAQGTPLGPFELAGLTVIALALADGMAALGFARQALAMAEAGGRDNDIGLSETLLAAVHGSGLLADAEDPRPHFEAGLRRMAEVRQTLSRAEPPAATAWDGAYVCATVLRRYGVYLLDHGEPERGRALLLEAQGIATTLGATGEQELAARSLAGDPDPRLRW